MLFRKCLQYLRKYYRKLGIPHHPKRHSSTSLARCWESDVKRQILRYTNLTRKHLTPEIPLFLITKKSPLWFATPEDCPFSDPFWAFYWPGGQALTRYVFYSLPNNKILDWSKVKALADDKINVK